MAENSELVRHIQKIVGQSGISAWLFYGFGEQDPIAPAILRFGPGHLFTRRWLYLIPSAHPPTKLVHRMEPEVLDHLPGHKRTYLGWEEYQAEVCTLLDGIPEVAMQYSEMNALPQISNVDAGTIELVRSCKTKVVSSAELIQCLEAVWSTQQISQHRGTALALTTIVQAAFAGLAEKVKRDGRTDELAVQNYILNRFEQEGLCSDHPPIVAVNENSADAHYQPTSARHSLIKSGDFLLIDLWAKPKAADAVYADITWTAFLGDSLPPKVEKIFQVVRRARDRGVEFLVERFGQQHPPRGWEVDDAVRKIIFEEGCQQFLLHRTGHNLGRNVHGNGVNFDNLETHDTRPVIPGIACTIEPGLYLGGEFGIRSEIDVFFSEAGPEVTTPAQNQVLLLPI